MKNGQNKTAHNSQAQGQTQGQSAEQPGQAGYHAAHAGADGSCTADDALMLPEISYTEADLSHLLFMIEEEKLAGDVYDALFSQTGLVVFDRIGDAEDRHMNTLLAQADALGLDVTGITSLPAGSYLDPELQTLYATLMAAASVSSDAALQVGADIEVADIADLELAMADLAGTPLGDVYAHLLNGSNHHLAAFESLLA